MSLDSFINRDKKKGTASHRRAPRQEKELARRIRTTVASGSKFEKGDVRYCGVVRIEAKTTKHRSFSVTLDMIDKIEDASIGAGELPVIVIEFNDGNGKPIREVAVVPSYVLDTIVLAKSNNG